MESTGCSISLGAHRGLLLPQVPMEHIGISRTSWSRPATKPGSRETRGERVRNSRRLRLKSLEKQEREQR